MAPTKVSISPKDQYQLMEPKKALKMFEDCKEYLQKNDSNYPSMALYTARSGMLYTFSVLCLNYELYVKDFSNNNFGFNT
jgi:hypothetical protein